MMFALAFPVAMGFAFGWLLQVAGVADSNVVWGQFRLRDFTMLKVILPAILVGGLGVLYLVRAGEAVYYVKDANLLAVGLGAAMFGGALAVLGYCPGAMIAAVGAGSAHALAGLLGMVFGAILYALSFDAVKAHVLAVWAFGKLRLPDLTGVPDLYGFAGLAIAAGLFFFALETRRRNA